jgi:hypothetical protein
MNIRAALERIKLGKCHDVHNHVVIDHRKAVFWPAIGKVSSETEREIVYFPTRVLIERGDVVIGEDGFLALTQRGRFICSVSTSLRTSKGR